VKIFLIISLLISTLSASVSDMESDIHKMVGDIRSKRKTLKLTKKDRNSLTNPFYRKADEVNSILKGKKKKKSRVVKKRKKRKPPKLSLEAIFDNRAKISGRWYSAGDFIKKQKIIKIEDNSILLRYRNKRYRLYFKSSRDKKISFEVQ